MRRRDPPPTGAVLYIRVSTQRQASEGVSLAAQEDSCRKHAERLGLAVLAVHRDEGISGKEDINNRPGLLAAVTECNEKNAVLVAYSCSRVARRQRLLWNLLDPDGPYGLRLSSATEPFDTSTPMGRAMLGMIGVWSQLEADMVSQRTKEALAYVKAQGKRLGRPPAPLPVDTLVRALALRAEGASWKRTVEVLNHEKLPAARGGKHREKELRLAVLREGPGRS